MIFLEGEKVFTQEKLTSVSRDLPWMLAWHRACLKTNGRRLTSREGQIMNKIAVTSEGPTLNDQVDPRFGRAAGFVVVDLDTMETDYIDNGASQAMARGAGIQAAELVARAGVSCLLTGYVGPKAFQALSAAGVKVGQNLEGLTVGAAVERFKLGQVEIARAANRTGR
jgi:predicted Fe-Mo cluster-binding NifX family protein